MQSSDYKYLLAYLGPVFAFWGLYFQSWMAPGMFYLAFLIIPLLELLLPVKEKSQEFADEASRKNQRFFDLLLYLHVPIIYGLLIYAFWIFESASLSRWDQIGMVLNMGTLLGAMGINIGHELGHRHTAFERFLSQLLLLPSHYLHFQIEHNLGHHKHVGTPEDPSTARLGESLYAFWWRSVTGVYRKAWTLERQRLERQGTPFLSIHNRMLGFTLASSTYLLVVFFTFDLQVLFFAFIIGVVGFLLLETVNYIEHYGLRRRKLPSGRYEAVNLQHSWNSNHELGRIFLFELTRHADHHYKATRPYQILRHFEESPQLPFGYPASMLLSLIPPLWFQKINDRVPEGMREKE